MGFGPALPRFAPAIQTLRERNEVTIDNAVGDAFKVRRARIEITRTTGQTLTTGTDEGAYSSVVWDLPEGTVGSPIEMELRVRRP